MRLRWAFLLTALGCGANTCYTAVANAQVLAVDPMANAKFFPMTYIDEASFEPTEFPIIAFPDSDWTLAKTCLAKRGVDTTGAAKPALIVIPNAHTIRVHDLTADSLAEANLPDSLKALYVNRFMAPTIAYTLMHVNIVLVTTRAIRSDVLQHEAIHSLLWQSRQVPAIDSLLRAGKWHPLRFFGPCAPGFLPTS